jgi:hypothetical protein
VLKPGGRLIFNVWDRIEENEFADTVTAALAEVFPDAPPRFMARTPHGYCECSTVERDLVRGGFIASPHITTVAYRSRAHSPREPAIAFCQGTPLRNEIDARDAFKAGEAADRSERAIALRFGDGAVEGMIQAHICTIQS